MRMLGEMAVANPTVGSFVEYCRDALGDWAGFSVGWLYWYFWAIVLAIEATAGATIIQTEWLPGVPQWLICLVLMAAADRHQPDLGQELRRVRVLVRVRSRSRRSSAFILIALVLHVGHRLGGQLPASRNLSGARRVLRRRAASQILGRRDDRDLRLHRRSRS